MIPAILAEMDNAEAINAPATDPVVKGEWQMALRQCSRHDLNQSSHFEFSGSTRAIALWILQMPLGAASQPRSQLLEDLITLAFAQRTWTTPAV